ncbi:polysaccharide pyruvyl transferase family protein [Sphingobium sufflavum]|uniref:polysaccharide pyruvyl transferase family protein n=1 Tax=Sphingobium sufflavum TaxID=1129547 RepID=UPI001F3E77C6|nr:polysaccharide pyruvyl transferase family protein [Sphingobium sufflavum]MCE7798531.1 polysaccharide pyruvyl transferase family protein [Sphingobium sufflavum]
MAHPIEIGLLWHSVSSGNLGVGALTLADMEIARRTAQEMGLEPRFTVLSMRDGETPPIVGPDVRVFAIDTRSLLGRTGYRAVIDGLDCILDIGAGDSFADIYGPKRFAFLWLTKFMALRRRIPLVLAPQTVGPFTKPLYRALGRYVMERSAAVVARDDKSFAVAQAMAPRARLAQAVDVAFVLPYESRKQAPDGRPFRIGINASGLLCHQAEQGTNRFGLSYDYLAFTRQLITTLLQRPGTEVHLISHATSRRLVEDDDAGYADRLAAEFPAAIKVEPFADPSEAKSYISGMDLLVAGRMHACIGAYSSRTPVIPVSYSRKFEGLFGMLDYRWVLPVSGCSTEQAVAFVTDALDRDLAAMTASIGEGLGRIETLLDGYRTILRETFAAAVEGKA